MVTMRVAAGRTVQVGSDTRYEYVTQIINGNEVKHPVQVPTTAQVYSEGMDVTLPEAEAKRLHAAGFLKKPDEPQTRPLNATAALEPGLGEETE